MGLGNIAGSQGTSDLGKNTQAISPSVTSSVKAPVSGGTFNFGTQNASQPIPWTEIIAGSVLGLIAIIALRQRKA